MSFKNGRWRGSKVKVREKKMTGSAQKADPATGITWEEQPTTFHNSSSANSPGQEEWPGEDQ